MLIEGPLSTCQQALRSHDGGKGREAGNLLYAPSGGVLSMAPWPCSLAPSRAPGSSTILSNSQAVWDPPETTSQAGSFIRRHSQQPGGDIIG